MQPPTPARCDSWYSAWATNGSAIALAATSATITGASATRPRCARGAAAAPGLEQQPHAPHHHAAPERQPGRRRSAQRGLADGAREHDRVVPALERVAVGVALEREHEFARRRPRPGQEAADRAGQLSGHQDVAVTQRDMPALVVEGGEQLVVVERHDRTRGDHEPRAAQPGDGDEHRAVGDHQALARARPDHAVAQQRGHPSRRAPELDDDDDQRARQHQRRQRQHDVGGPVPAEDRAGGVQTPLAQRFQDGRQRQVDLGGDRPGQRRERAQQQRAQPDRGGDARRCVLEAQHVGKRDRDDRQGRRAERDHGRGSERAWRASSSSAESSSGRSPPRTFASAA